MANYVDVTNTLKFSVAFNRTSAFPLDAKSMFGSLAAAQAAAATAENAGSSNTVYYFGQTLTVFENDVATQYVINGDKTLKEVGSATLGDDKTITLDAENKTLSLKSFGVEYYAYNHADTIIEPGNYTYPDNMPAVAEVGSYVKIETTWYKKGADAWAVATEEPHTEAYYNLTTGWKAGLEPKVAAAEGNTFVLAWYEPSQTTVEGLSSALTSVQGEVSNLNTRVGTAETKIASNTAAIEAEVTRATGVEAGLNTRLTTAEGSLTTLNGDETTPGSVKKQVADAIATIIAGAPESFDTLKEISDWISSHANDAAAMNSQITDNKNAIATINTLLGTSLPEGTTATTVIGYIAEAVEVEKTRALAAEAALDGKITAINALTATFGDIVTHNVAEFATAAQGAKADTAVQSVVAGKDNGKIAVDGKDVVAYTLPAASTAVLGGTKVDGTSISATADGTISVEAVDKSKVTGLDTAISTAAQNAVDDAKTYTDTTAVAKTAIVPAADLASSVETASDTKVASEKALIESMTWKTTM